MQWRVPGSHVLSKVIAAVLFAALPVIRGGDWSLLLLAGVAALACAVLAIRDLVAPVRLAADVEGVTVVSGFASKVAIPWAKVERLQVDVRRRALLRTELLEIDTAEGLHLFSRYDLGAPPEEVLAELRLIRSGRSTAA
jgi:Bacterial PH domain